MEISPGELGTNIADRLDIQKFFDDHMHLILYPWALCTQNSFFYFCLFQVGSLGITNLRISWLRGDVGL